MSTSIVKRALEIVEEALELPCDAQQEFVEQACGGDDVMRREVDSLLSLDSGVFIEELAVPDEWDEHPIGLSSAERYELQDQIGRGGMGTVFRAHDHQLDREVAVKILRERTTPSRDMLSRFAVEAQIGARLQHPGIAPVYDLGRLPDGRAFFAMKLVRGQTMASLLSARSDPLDDRSQLLSVFEQLCQTLAYAHSNGIIHRDLKPDNVMVGEFGEVQVMDWGLAKRLEAGDRSLVPVGNSFRTLIAANYSEKASED
jgi:serine/threonine protein kinase